MKHWLAASSWAGLVALGSSAAAPLDSLLGRSQAPEFLPVEQAFQLHAAVPSPDRFQLSWIIAPGYYLYRDRLKFSLEDAPTGLGNPTLPAGTRHNDEFFGEQVVYYGSLVVELPVVRNNTAALPVKLKVTYQGCADAGLCYPPQTALLPLQLPAAQVSPPKRFGLIPAALVAMLAIGLIIAGQRGWLGRRRSGT